MSAKQGYLVSDDRAGIVSPKGYFMVTGAMNGQSRAFEMFAHRCGNREHDTYHPIDPAGPVDVNHIADYVSTHIARHAGILVGICDQSLDPASRTHIVERHTIDVAKRCNKKVVVLFQDSDHLMAPSFTDRGRSEMVDVVVLHDVLFAASAAAWEKVAKTIFPNAAVVVARSIAWGGSTTRQAIDRALV